MDKETLFKEIRQGRVLLWAGAGFSRYAGYPMGSGVVQALYGALSKGQQQQLATALDQTESSLLRLPLPDFAQYFLDLHNGNKQRLIQVISQLFSASPVSKITHEQVATIPHFDRIVTTNYDRLFEESYRPDKLHVVTQADNIPQVDDKAVTLFKIHGELNRPNSLIVAQNDYRRFFDKADDVVWTQLRSLMSTRTIAFIGYAVEDPNVLDAFLELVNRLGELMRPAYVIGPSMDFLRIERLKRQNIYFIKSTGEDFIEDLIANINDNIIKDVETGITSADIFKEFMASRDLRAKLSSSKNGFRISDLTKSNGEAAAKVKLDFNKNPQLEDKIAEAISGFGYEPITLLAEDLENADIRIENLRLPLDGFGEHRITLTPIPVHEGLYDFLFNDYEASNIHVKAFRIHQGYKVIASIHTASITLEINLSGDTNPTSFVTLENILEDESTKPSSTKEQIEIYQFISSLAECNSFRCFSHTKQTIHELTPISNNLAELSRPIHYFKKLRDIENEFKVRFTRFRNLNETYKDVNNLHKAIHGVVEEAEWDTEIPFEQLGDFANLSTEQMTKDLILKKIESVNLVIHEKAISVNLIQDIRFVEPVITNSKYGQGLCLKSKNNLFVLTNRYGPYDES